MGDTRGMASSATDLAQEILPYFRTRNADLWRWRASNEYGSSAHEGVDLLESAALEFGPEAVYPVVTKAISSTVTAILHADDSSGIIGDAIRRLLDLHARLACQVKPPARPLVDWLIRFHFDSKQDYFDIDPGRYADALGDSGMDLFRAALDAVAATGIEFPDYIEPFEWIPLAPEGVHYTLKITPDASAVTLRHLAIRMAVFDHDTERIVHLVAGSRTGAHISRQVAELLAEAGDIDGAITWAHGGMNEDGFGHHERACARIWCELLAEHRPDEELAARREVVARFRTSEAASALKATAGADFPRYIPEIEAALDAKDEETVQFVGWVLGDIPRAWAEAERRGVTSRHLWERLCADYGAANPSAVIPVLRDLVDGDLETANAQNYRTAAWRLVQMRRLALAAGTVEEFEDYLVELRETHRRRPRLQQEFTRAGL